MPQTPTPVSEFIESVEEMIARDYASDAKGELRDVMGVTAKDWPAVEKLLYQLTRRAMAHARSQTDGRRAGTMIFDEAMRLVSTRETMVTRSGWNIFCAVRKNEDGSLGYWKLDNADGGWSGDGWPYNPTDEDRAATDWMLYQAPQENWVELDLWGPLKD